MEKLKFIFAIFAIIVIATSIIGVAIYTLIQVRKYQRSESAFEKSRIKNNTGLTIAIFAIALISFMAAAKSFY